MVEGETHSSTRKSNLEEQVEMKHKDYSRNAKAKYLRNVSLSPV